MGNQLREIENHIASRIRSAKHLAIDVHSQGAMHSAVVPIRSQLIGRDDDRAERSRRL